MTQDMETFSARLASFDLVLQPEKRRGSSAKTAKAIAWPHRRPSPAELAHAGFFYNPYETNPDNTTCFLCRRALDGWEEEDNPITEHLKHSPDCGWALMMDIQQHSSNPAEIEDPTSDTIRQARLATFGELWPHDGKKGWVCQSEKMVDGGWYFCPTEESDDLASCAYCKLSLDGWEPKDNPFDEHYRRSSDCSFFVFAQSGGKKKTSRSKKARTSKASRQSTQSTISEAPVSDVDVIDPPMSQSTTKSKSTKKSSKTKTKTSKSKKADPEPSAAEMEIDNGEQPQPEDPQPKRATRGKKRASGEVDSDQERSGVANTQDVEHAEAPTKKKAKKSRESAQERGEQEDLVIADAQQDEDAAREPQEPQEQEEPKKTRGTSKKKTSSKSRKASESSTAQQTAKSEEPQDVDMYAALEAELDHAGSAQSNEETEKKTAKKSKSKSKKKKKDTSPEPPAEAVDQVEQSHPGAPEETQTAESPVPEEPAQPKTKRESSQREKSRGRSSSRRVTEEPTEPAKPAEPVPEPDHESDDDRDVDVSRHESFVSVEITNKKPVEDPPAEPGDKGTKKKQKQKTSLEKTKKPKKSSKTAPEPVPSVEEQVEEQVEEPKAEERVQPEEPPKPQDTQEAAEPEPDSQPPRRRSSRVPPKTAERYSDIPEERQFAKSLAQSRGSSGHAAPEDDVKADEPEAVSPIPSASKSTPSLSPQSSDAENRPPFMKPSASRAVAASPSKQPSLRVPLAPSTPSPSKRTANAGGLSSSCPWKAIDIDEILLAGNSDKENVDITTALSSVKGDLTSPEKKMTVEQWITWNAKNGEERLRRECERLVGQFEKEGARAMRVLEGIECTD
ncbi:hypothetical protein P170DRAFT_411206 [Aspergillus steynii IBT 23096]|uniref:BIR-domain-containing protein n=1 Tax=Aspergillus steynii IBT 23096 TaxID=1392250 RepID=A0A2I2G693_9EURO|nr:uncharacterized protein P170DRAFT_411206 [Aspergillus steynii IBT 23096]PLB48389.1 hypothetical protein P170DRAFT_411206 [Aspergillus steynii IBT 23096]